MGKVVYQFNYREIIVIKEYQFCNLFLRYPINTSYIKEQKAFQLLSTYFDNLKLFLKNI